MNEYISHLNVKELQQDLINWYNKVKRDLPWRENLDPYRILVSEIMLQQTQVVTVIPYFKRFMALFPTTKQLAEADEQTLLKAWEGLGYYSRARNLQESARMIEALGQFPTTYEGILKLKGVGPYTAGAIGSIAFSLATPAVDGNVFRVISRVCCIFEDIGKAKTRKTFETVVADIISRENPGDFNQGLMELGATICKPKSPKCLECPIRNYCQAYEQGVDELLPVKSKTGKQTKVKFVVGIVQNQYGELLIQKRPNYGLLANFYELKSFEYQGEVEPQELLIHNLTEAGYQVESIQPIGTFNHPFSHRIWEMESYKVVAHVDLTTSGVIGEGEELWIKPSHLQDYPLAVAHLKILSHDS